MLTLVGKPGCHLCDEARVIVAQVCAETATDWEEVSVLDELALFDCAVCKQPEARNRALLADSRSGQGKSPQPT